MTEAPAHGLTVPEIARRFRVSEPQRRKPNVKEAIAGRREMMAKCIHAWNAWRRDERTALKYFKDAPIPKAF
jgi:hypothetical protein